MRFARLPISITIALLLGACSGAAPTATPREGELAQSLLNVSPQEGTTVGLDLRVCATFDISSPTGMHGWTGPMWFEVAGTRVHVPAGEARSPAWTLVHEECSEPLDQLVPRAPGKPSPDALESGPLRITVGWEDVDGAEHEYSWEVQLDLGPRAVASEEVQRIRDLYRPLGTIDEHRGRSDQTIAGYLLRDDVLRIYLLDNADPDIALADATRVLGDGIPSGGIRVVKPERPFEQWELDQWRDTAQAVAQVEGTNVHGFSRGGNRSRRVSYRVPTAYSAHVLRRAIDDTEMPQEAVAIEIPKRPQVLEPADPGPLSQTLAFAPLAESGSAIAIAVVWTNVSDQHLEFVYSPVVPTNIVVFSEDGEMQWASHDGGAYALVGRLGDLAPGEQLRFVRYWDLTDEDGFALPPGDYLVQAQGHIADNMEGVSVTELRPLRITE